MSSGNKLVIRHSDKQLFGVCAALGRYFSMDPTIARVIFVLATVFGVGSPLIIYGILALVIPKE